MPVPAHVSVHACVLWLNAWWWPARLRIHVSINHLQNADRTVESIDLVDGFVWCDWSDLILMMMNECWFLMSDFWVPIRNMITLTMTIATQTCTYYNVHIRNQNTKWKLQNVHHICAIRALVKTAIRRNTKQYFTPLRRWLFSFSGIVTPIFQRIWTNVAHSFFHLCRCWPYREQWAGVFWFDLFGNGNLNAYDRW